MTPDDKLQVAVAARTTYPHPHPMENEYVLSIRRSPDAQRLPSRRSPCWQSVLIVNSWEYIQTSLNPGLDLRRLRLVA
jgi:hypothetical protein